MKPDSLLKTFSSFRSQMVAFIAGMMVLTTIALYLVNQRSEKRIAQQVEDYIHSTVQATDLVLRSLSEGKYLYEILPPRKDGKLPAGSYSERIISNILVVDSGTKKIFDSTDRSDIGKPLDAEIASLPAFKKGDLRKDASARSVDRTIQFSFETDKAKRTVIIVVSMQRFYRITNAAERDRLIAIGVLGVLVIGLIYAFSKRFTRPITELGQAAARVTSGDLDFKVSASGPEEVRALSSTFNEMLAGLRRNRELEDQLQRAERSAVVGRLASGIAHEIRNPLNFINLSIDHIREKFAPQGNGDRAEYTQILTTIKDELARLNRLVSDFLSYGRPAKLKPREIDTQSLIEEVRTLVAAQSEQQNVKINIIQNGNGNSKVQGDAEQLKTCFSNLMINAIQAMPQGGALDITVSPNSSLVKIDFADTGVGIESEALQQIFEPYYSTKDTGIGLGLPLTKKIIEEHGGQIAVESEISKGTMFTVTLQRNPK